MSTFDFPTLPLSRCLFNIVFNGELTTSKTSGAEHVTDNPGERWIVQYRFKVLTADEAKLLKQHLSRLRGPVNKTRLYDTRFTNQSGSWAGSPVTDGANQYGLYADVRGFSANDLVAKASDRVMIGDQLLEIAEDATTDGTGRCRLYFTNELRALTADATPLVSNINSLRVTARWTKPEQIQQFSSNGRLYRDITLDFIESFV